MNSISAKIKEYSDKKDNQNPFSYKLEKNIWFYGENEPRVDAVKKYGNPDFAPFLDGENFKLE
jgi:hypothetical protein